jgi:hypothetical protein
MKMGGNSSGAAPLEGDEVTGYDPTAKSWALIRNKNWLAPKLADVLRKRGVALALIDQSWMPRPAEWFEPFVPMTDPSLPISRTSAGLSTAKILSGGPKHGTKQFLTAASHYRNG